MSRRVLFCGLNEEAAILYNLLSLNTPTVYLINTDTSKEDLGAQLRSFLDDDEGLLICSPLMAYGWLAPEGTALHFLPSFPQGETRAQAEARVRKDKEWKDITFQVTKDPDYVESRQSNEIVYNGILYKRSNPEL